MRIPGYCERCHKIKHVSVNSAGMVQVALGRTAFGLCAQCEDEERNAARGRHPSRRGPR